MPTARGTKHCRNCRYQLDGLATHRCPECGDTFDPADAGTYLVGYEPCWRFIACAMLAVVLPALLLGFFLVPISRFGFVSIGYGVVLATPFLLGALFSIDAVRYRLAKK